MSSRPIRTSPRLVVASTSNLAVCGSSTRMHPETELNRQSSCGAAFTCRSPPAVEPIKPPLAAPTSILPVPFFTVALDGPTTILCGQAIFHDLREHTSRKERPATIHDGALVHA